MINQIEELTSQKAELETKIADIEDK